MFCFRYLLAAVVFLMSSVACTANKENLAGNTDTPTASNQADMTSLSQNDSTDTEETDSLDVEFCNKIIGDFNGDGRSETAVLSLKDSTYECYEFDKETSLVSFSNKGIPTLAVKGEIFGHIQNLGDINGDGRDEIGLYSFAGYSNFRFYYVYGLRKGKWCNVVRPFELHYDVWLDHGTDFKPIRKLSRKKVYIYTNVWNPETEWPDFTWIKVRLKR